jgi:hypothetical protein
MWHGFKNHQKLAGFQENQGNWLGLVFPSKTSWLEFEKKMRNFVNNKIRKIEQ